MQLLKDLATILDIPYGTIEKRSSGPANNYYNYLSSFFTFWNDEIVCSHFCDLRTRAFSKTKTQKKPVQWSSVWHFFQ